jgi:PhnB protein
MQQLVPYLLFDGNCQEAFEFYAKNLGGKIEAMLPHTGTPAESQAPPEWGAKILHAMMKVGDGVLMASDCPPNRYAKPQGFSVSYQTTTPEDAERVFAALAEGGSVQMPIGPTFWASRFGMCVDRFGIPWMINCYAEQTTPAA